MLYFFIVFFSTTLGSLTGMGGGIIIKPLLDMLGNFAVSDIGLLSSITVLVMAIISVGKLSLSETRHAPIVPSFAISLTVGSVLGGNLGHELFSLLLSHRLNNSSITLLQNILLALIVAIVVIYMLSSPTHRKPPRFGPMCPSAIQAPNLSHIILKNSIPALFSGILLGTISTFLGIGGGPINIAFLIFFFALDTKSSVIYSLICILFAQTSQLLLLTISLSADFSGYNLHILPFMIPGAIIGGFLGASLNKKLSEKHVRFSFIFAQFIVLCICIINICKNL